MRNKTIMQSAWNLAHRAAAQHGGKPSEYIAESMRLVWASYKQQLAKKGGDLVGIAEWFLKKNFSHPSMITQIQTSPLKIVRRTAKAYQIEVAIMENGKQLDSFKFWAPKSVCA